MELRTAAATRELSLEGHGLPELPPLPPGLRTLAVGGNALSAAALAGACGLRGTARADPAIGTELSVALETENTNR